jgi:hypothetical protein
MLPIDIELNKAHMRDMLNQAEKARKERGLIEDLKHLKRKLRRDNEDHE